MSETASLAALCRSFQAKYETWQGCRGAGIHALFVRMHLREIRKVIEQIESLEQGREERSADVMKIEAQINEIKSALFELDQVVAENAARQTLLECLASLPELRLVEIDRVLGGSIDVAALEGVEAKADEVE